jgi:beta-phosphoglucomutase-like phosphatase (HAD superfamily)
VLVVFDVDGTLIESVALDAELYDRAFLETFGVRLPTTDWATYRNATDAGIAEEAVERLGLPTARVVELRRRFVELLETVEVIPAVAGACTIVGELRSRGMAVAIATGGWSDAAAAKLRAAGVEVGDVPLVGSEVSPRRADIVQAAIDRARSPGPTCYVGDGEWDLAASRALAIGFVGVDHADHRRLPAPSVRDFRDVDAFVRMLTASLTEP